MTIANVRASGPLDHAVTTQMSETRPAVTKALKATIVGGSQSGR